MRDAAAASLHARRDLRLVHGGNAT